MEAVGYFKEEFCLISSRISSEELEKLYFDLKSNPGLLNKDLTLKIPDDRIGRVFLFKTSARSGCGQRWKIRDDDRWKNNKSGVEMKSNLEGLSFKRNYYYSLADKRVRRMIVDFFEEQYALVLYYKAGDWIERVSLAQKKSYSASNRANADELKRKKSKLYLGSLPQVNAPWFKNLPTEYIFGKSRSLNALFGAASVGFDSANYASVWKTTRFVSGDLYVFAKKDILKNQTSNNKLIYCDGAPWKSYRMKRIRLCQIKDTLVTIKYYSHVKNSETKKIIFYTDCKEYDFIFVYYYQVCCDKFLSWFQFVLHNGHHHHKHCHCLIQETAVDPYRTEFLAQFPLPVANTFNDFHVKKDKPDELFQSIDPMALRGFLHAWPGRVYLSTFQHVDGYDWKLKKIQNDCYIYESENNISLSMLKEVFPISKKLILETKLPLLFLPTHFVIYFYTCPLCECSKFETEMELDRHIENCHADIFSQI